MLKAMAQRKVCRFLANIQCCRRAHLNVGQSGMLYEQISLRDIPEKNSEMARFCDRKRFAPNGQVYPVKFEAAPLLMANNLEISSRETAVSIGRSLPATSHDLRTLETHGAAAPFCRSHDLLQRPASWAPQLPETHRSLLSICRCPPSSVEPGYRKFRARGESGRSEAFCQSCPPP